MTQKSNQKRGIAQELSLYEQRVLRYQQPLFAFLGRMGFEQCIAEELAQETFLRAWRFRQQFDETKAQYSTWLFRIARNVALTELDRKRRIVDQADTEHVMSVAGVSRSTDFADEAELQQRLSLALKSMSVEEQETIALGGIQQLSHEESAAIAGCSAPTFRVRLSRARARLKKLWEAGN